MSFAGRQGSVPAASAGTAPPATTSAGRRPRVRHGVLAIGLLVLAALRAWSGDWLWAALFGLGAVAETAVLVLDRPTATRSSVGRGPAARMVTPSASTVALSVKGHRQSELLWTAVLAGTLLAGLLLVTTSPSLAALVAGVALLALVKVRRERGTVRALRLVQLKLATGGGSREGGTSRGVA